MSNYVRRVGVCRWERYQDDLGTECARVVVRGFVRDVSEDEGAQRVEWTPLRDLAARYFDQTHAHRVAELARRSIGGSEFVRVFRARLPV